MANTSRGIWYVDPGTEVSLAQITEDVATSVDNALGVIEADLNAIPVIDWGTVTVGAISAGATEPFTITFNKTFTSPPNVSPTVSTNIPQNRSVAVQTVTTTTASGFVHAVTSTSGLNIRWIAVGV